MIVAIDGPAASGKSTTARLVAEALGYCHLNSGLLYRAITWAAVEGGWIDDLPEFGSELKQLELTLERDAPGYRVLIGGRDPGAGLTSPDTSHRVSEIAARKDVRVRVLALLQAERGRGGIVCDGRDIGTVVFPDAEVKVFLVASPEERGRRRLLELGLEPSPAKVREEARRLTARDTADSNRRIAPLRKAPDALELDTTRMTPEAVVARIVYLARARAASIG